MVRSVLCVLLVIVFSHLARPHSHKYDNGAGVKTRGIDIREPDSIARSHAGPREYLTRHAVV